MRTRAIRVELASGLSVLVAHPDDVLASKETLAGQDNDAPQPCEAHGAPAAAGSTRSSSLSESNTLSTLTIRPTPASSAVAACTASRAPSPG